MDARQHIINEAIAEQVQIFGMEQKDSQWILTSWDTWEKNPYYHGPDQRHPEDDGNWDGFHSDAEADADVLASAGWGTDEDYGCYGEYDF